jgi:hypothetical protein
MRKWIGPDQARPVQDCQSGAQSSPTFRWDRTGLSPTPDRVRPDWWNHCKSHRAKSHANAVRVYSWIKPSEALIACGKIYKYRDALYLCIKPLCKSESKDK